MRVVTTVQELIDDLIELIGIKSGLAISEEDFLRSLREGHDLMEQETGEQPALWWAEPRDLTISIRAEAIEVDFILVMNRIGAIQDFQTPMQLVVNWARDNAPRRDDEGVDEYVQRLSGLLIGMTTYGETPPGAEELAAEVRRRFILERSMPEHRTWDGLIPLSDLFESEEIPAASEPGAHFDQRFIDYLLAQPGQLKKIHWRQFEFICAEYFSRNGYDVKVTPPRADGGIDVFARREGGTIGPELIVIQAKRLSGRNTVQIEDVKALWTDAEDHRATRALIVTTTRLPIGARKFCEARKYRISAVEGEEVAKWLENLSRGVTVELGDSPAD